MKTKEEQAVELLANTIAEIMKNNNSELIDALPFDRTFIGIITAYKGKGVYSVSVSGKTYDLPYLIGEDWDSAIVCGNEAENFKGGTYKNEVAVNFKKTSGSSKDLSLRHAHVFQDPTYTSGVGYGEYCVTSRETVLKNETRDASNGQTYWMNEGNSFYANGHLMSVTTNPAGNTPWGSDGVIKATVSLGDLKAKVFRKNNPLNIGDKVVCKAPQNNKNDMYIEGRLSA